MKGILLAACVICGCGKPDDCTKLFDRMASSTKDLADRKELAKNKDDFLQMCHKEIDRIRKDRIMRCVLDASDDDAVTACVGKPFGEYMKRSKVSEAEIRLNAIAKSAKRVYGDTSAFPTGTSKVLPDRNGNPVGGGCCGSMGSGSNVDNKCPPSKDWAGDPVWSALGFQIDEPTLYRYKYESADGKTFTATATGDADCDGHEAVFTVTGKLDASGSPTTELTMPPKGQY